MITYHCEGCGIEVHNFAKQAVPEHGFCLTCELLDNSHRHDLKEFWSLYALIAAAVKPSPRSIKRGRL